MKTVTHRPSFQGDLMIRRIDNLPSGVTQAAPDNDVHILAHSETGHHHVIESKGASVSVLDRQLEGMRVLRAILENPTSLEHLRDHDTHEPIVMEPGLYEFRIGREFDPYQEIARRQAD